MLPYLARFSGIFTALVLISSHHCRGEGSRLDGAFRIALQSLCFDCHGPGKQKGDIRLDTLPTDFSSAETWHDALDQLNRGEMPPPKARQPSPEELRLLTTGLDDYLEAAAEAKRLSGGRLSTRRLTRYEYANTMRDLLGLDLDYAGELPPDPESPDGFLNNGTTLEMSPIQIETSLEIARRALAIAIPDPGTEPKTHHIHQAGTAMGRLPNRKDGGHEPVNPEYILDMAEFPREGEFEVRITARLANPDSADFPRMQVSLGHVPGIIHVPRKILAEVDLTSPGPETFVFRGRIEDFPQPGPIPFGRSGFRGMILMVDFIDANGEALRYPDKRYAQLPAKPKKGQKPPPELPPSPPFGSRLEVIIDSAEFEGPLPRPPLISSRNAGDEIDKFATRAFRRPATATELATYEGLFEGFRGNGATFEEAIRETFAAILVSPSFLYINEPGKSDSLSDYQLATRLSFFLWSTQPDKRLLELASLGELAKRDVLAGEVERMLKHPKSDEFIERFAYQWFGLDALQRVAVNPNTFPDFEESLKSDFRKEVQEVFAEVVRNDLTALELLDSNWTMVSRNLAAHYGIKGPRSSRFERVLLPAGSPHGGILGQAAFHLIGSDGDESHPIKRAVWILDRLLDDPPGSPPPDAPELDSENPDLAKLSLREQLEAHRKKESCNNCHRGIDPWGLPLEEFNALGHWRKRRENEPVPVLLPDGSEVTDTATLKKFLIEKKREWFARSAVRRLTTYALGRSTDLGDREAIDVLTRAFEKHGYRFRPLIVELVCSEMFRK